MAGFVRFIFLQMFQNLPLDDQTRKKNSHMDYIILLPGRTAFTELSLGMMPLAFIKDVVKNSSVKPFTLFTGMILLHSPAIQQVEALRLHSALRNA